MNRSKNERNALIFGECLAGKPFKIVAADHQVTSVRIEQVFRAEATRLYPEVVAVTATGHGFRRRFLANLKAWSDKQQPSGARA